MRRERWCGVRLGFAARACGEHVPGSNSMAPDNQPADRDPGRRSGGDLGTSLRQLPLFPSHARAGRSAEGWRAFAAQWGPPAGQAAFCLLLMLPPFQDFTIAVAGNFAVHSGMHMDRTSDRRLIDARTLRARVVGGHRTRRRADDLVEGQAVTRWTGPRHEEPHPASGPRRAGARPNSPKRSASRATRSTRWRTANSIRPSHWRSASSSSSSSRLRTCSYGGMDRESAGTLAARAASATIVSCPAGYKFGRTTDEQARERAMNTYRNLSSEKIADTLTRSTTRIGERFPRSGLYTSARS